MVLNIVVVKPLLELGGAFVIELVKLWFTASFGECAMDICYRFGYVIRRSGFNRTHEDTVAVVVIGYDQVVVTMA